MKHILLLLALAPLLAGCAGVSVKQDYDTSVNFQKMRTYAWQAHVNKETGTVSADNSLVGERVRNSVDAVLSAKGYQKAPSGGADFLVEYSYNVAKETDSGSGTSSSVSFGTSFSRGYGMFGMGVGQSSSNTEMETLSVDISSPAASKLIWRGFVEQELVRRDDPNKSAQDIRKTVEKILSKFPPKTKAVN